MSVFFIVGNGVLLDTYITTNVNIILGDMYNKKNMFFFYSKGKNL